VYPILNSEVVSLNYDSWKYKDVCTSGCRLSITGNVFSLINKRNVVRKVCDVSRYCSV